MYHGYDMNDHSPPSSSWCDINDKVMMKTKNKNCSDFSNNDTSDDNDNDNMNNNYHGDIYHQY